MMSSMSAGSTPDRRMTSGSTVVISVSGGVLTSVPLNERPMAVLAALTITGVGMFRPRLSALRLYKSSRYCIAASTWPASLRLGYVEVLVTQPERLLGPHVLARLDEVEPPRRELQVRPERVEQMARAFLALVRLVLRDEREGVLRDHDAAGRHLPGPLGPV